MTNNQKDYKSILTKEFLEDRYVEKDMFAKDIAREVGCSVVTVTNYLRKHGIEVKSKYRKRNLRGLSPARKVMTKDYLQREYEEKGRALTDIALELECGITTVKDCIEKAGLTVRERNRGDYSTTFKGVMEDKDYLYIYMPEHPSSTKRGYVRLHRLLAEHYYGRSLKPNEVVHHKNGDATDNRKSNLVIMDKAEHDRFHTQQRWLETQKNHL